jgi:hypothetical protein
MATLSPKNPLSVIPFRRLFSKKGNLRQNISRNVCRLLAMLAPQNISDGGPNAKCQSHCGGEWGAATAAPGSGIIVLSDPFRTAPVIIDNPHLLDMQPMWANCPTSDNFA